MTLMHLISLAHTLAFIAENLKKEVFSHVA